MFTGHMFLLLNVVNYFMSMWLNTSWKQVTIKTKNV